MEEVKREEVALDEMKCLKLKLTLQELANLNLQGELLTKTLDEKLAVEQQLKTELVSVLTGDPKDWQLHLDKNVAIKREPKSN